MERAVERTRVLVTGATGFIGKSLCEYLADHGFEVIRAVRQLSSAASDSIVVGNIDADTDWIDALVGCDYVIHLAARVHVMSAGSKSSMDLYRSTNMEGTRNLARQAATAGIRRFIYLSSIKVNGEQTTSRAFSADDEPNPNDNYAVSKYEAETALKDVCEQSDMEYVIIRPPLVYGPGVPANFLNLIKLVNLGMPLPFDAINNMRSLLALSNLQDFIQLVLVHEKAANQAFLISDGVDISTPDLISKIASALGKKILLFPVPVSILGAIAATIGRGSEIDRLAGSLQLDIRKSETLLGWRPVLDQNTALQQTVDWFRENADR